MANFLTSVTVAGSGSSQALPSSVTTSGGFTMERVRIYVETAPIRFRLDAGAPVAITTGEPAEVGKIIELFGAEIADFRFINETGTNASLKCHGAVGLPGHRGEIT